MEREWHYTQAGQQHGPVTDAELKRLATEGTLRPDDLVWREGMSDWRRASTVKEIFPKQPTAPSAAMGTAQPSSSLGGMKPTSSIPKAVKYSALGCSGFLMLILVCSGLLRIIATIVDPEGFANVQAGKNRDGSEQYTAASLTADFYPFQPDTSRQTISTVYLPNGTMQSRIEIIHTGTGTIRRRKVNHFAMPGNVELPLGKPQVEQYRRSSGFIEISREVGISKKETVALPVLKLGTRVGDQWEYNDEGMKIVYVLRSFEDKEIHEALVPSGNVHCAIVEETWFMDAKPTLKTITTYGKGLGPLSIEVSSPADDGEWKPIRSERLVPTLQE